MNKLVKLLIALLLVLTATFVNARVSSVNFVPPVFWNVFEVTATKNNVLLKWVVTEYNNKNFYIQHSYNGTDWEDIDSINSKNSPLTLDDYSYTHINKHEGRHYYRIKQIDIDMNRTGFSKVLTVTLKKEKLSADKEGISFSPNPATDQVRIVNNDGSDDSFSGAKIYDLSGKLVADKKLQKYTNTIFITDLPNGIYIARVENNDGTTFTHKFIKQ